MGPMKGIGLVEVGGTVIAKGLLYEGSKTGVEDKALPGVFWLSNNEGLRGSCKLRSSFAWASLDCSIEAGDCVVRLVERCSRCDACFLSISMILISLRVVTSMSSRPSWSFKKLSNIECIAFASLPFRSSTK